MAKDKGEKRGNGAAVQSASTEVETLVQPETSSPAESTAGDTSAQQYGETTATEAPAQDEPGPEDFERHGGSRLVEDHAKDLALQKEIEQRIGKREEVIAARVRAKGVNATVVIAGQEYTARQKPNGGGKLGLAKVNPRVPTSIDI